MKIRAIIFFVLISGVFQLSAQEYSSVKSSETIIESRKTFYVHTVEKGNTLYNISKTYAVAPNVILQYNPELNDGLKLGMKLKIPKVEQKEEDFIYHIVKKQETLYQISKIYNVTVDDIIRINHLKSEEISTGQYIKIPSLLMNADADLKLVESQENTEIKKTDDSKYFIYTVKPKETLFSISKRFGISTDALMYLNDLSSTTISTGQELKIPNKLIQKKEESHIDNDKYITHKVQAKETLFGIARLYAVSVSDIEKSNELGDAQIQIGQTLLIPRALNETGFIEHEVTDRKEKLTKIAREYNLSVEELKEANPHSPNKLKRGQTVLIPIGYIESEFDQEELSNDTILIDDDNAGIDDESIVSGCRKLDGQTKKYHIAFMLPLYLNDVDSLLAMDQMELLNHADSKPFKFIEFYEGALIAAQEMYDQGLDFKLHVYDVPRDVEGTADVLKDPMLEQMDLIISLSYSNSFNLISDFSKIHGIPLINAVSKRREIIYKNPNVFKIEPNEEFLYKKTSDYILENYPEHNIILVKSNPYQLAKEFAVMQESLQLGIPTNVALPNDQILYKVSSFEMEYSNALPRDFAYKMTKELKDDNPAFDYDIVKAFPADTLILRNKLQTVDYSKDSLRGVVHASSLFRNNLIIALGQDEIFAIELFTQLNSVRDSFNYEVIGLPNWNNYNSLDVAYTQPMKLHIVNSKFVDYHDPIVKDFVLNFRSEYGIEPEINKHAFLGYDIAKYFLTALKDFGDHFTNCLDDIDVELLQNQFQFEHKQDLGYENINWNILKQEDYQYKKVD
jgi:LysM repeat protein